MFLLLYVLISYPLNWLLLLFLVTYDAPRNDEKWVPRLLFLISPIGLFVSICLMLIPIIDKIEPNFVYINKIWNKLFSKIGL